MYAIGKTGSVAGMLLAAVLLAGAIESVADPLSVVRIAVSLMLITMGIG